MDDGLPGRHRHRRSSSSCCGLEVEAGLLAGDLADRLGPPHVQRLLGPAGGQDGGFVGDPGLQVQGVGEVELPVDPGGAGEGDLGVLDREVPAIGCSTALFFGFGGHEPADGVGDEPVDLGGTDPVREGCDLGVHEPSGLDREADRLAGDPPGPPRGQVTGQDPGPGAREAVGQLDRFAEVGLAGLGGQPHRERELRHAELRDQRCAGSGDRERLVAVTGEQGGVVDRLGRVQVGPGDGCLQRSGTRRCRQRLDAHARTSSTAGGGVEVGCRRGHGPILLEHTFDSRQDSVDFPLMDKGFRRGLDRLDRQKGAELSRWRWRASLTTKEREPGASRNALPPPPVAALLTTEAAAAARSWSRRARWRSLLDHRGSWGLDRLDHQEGRRFRDGAGAPPQPPQAGSPPGPAPYRPLLLRFSTTRVPPGLDKLDHQKRAEVSRRRWRASSTTEERMPEVHPDPRRTRPLLLRISTNRVPPGLDKLDHQQALDKLDHQNCGGFETALARLLNHRGARGRGLDKLDHREGLDELDHHVP